jgi:DNA-binding LacI/PurR family transcriptional regulator
VGITIKQIATEVGLSWPAVSQILNNRGRFAADTRERVLAVAAKRGYRPNSSARALRQQSSKLVGVLFRNNPSNALTNMVAFESFLGINQRFQEEDFATVLIRAGELERSDSSEPRVFRERLVDGVIVVGGVPEPLLSRVRALSQHVIWLDTDIWNDTCCVRRDEQAAGEQCVKVLAELGYKKVAFIAREASRHGHHSHYSREAGAKLAAQASRIRLQSINWPEEDPQLEYEALVDLLKPDMGLVAGSLPIARRVIHGAESLGLSAGYDFGLVCCDESFDTQANWRGLSRIDFDRYALGEKAAEMMLSLLATPSTPPPSYVQKNKWVIGCTAWGPTLTPRPRP